MGLHCFFGLMFREISILFIHYSGNEKSIAGMQSDRPVANMGHMTYSTRGSWYMSPKAFCKLEAFFGAFSTIYSLKK